jgi:hypothetical protein
MDTDSDNRHDLGYLQDVQPADQGAPQIRRLHWPWLVLIALLAVGIGALLKLVVG